QSFGRYLAFGLIALPLAWFDRAKLKELVRADWIEALKLALVGNIVYYLLLASSIQRAGGPLPTMIIGTLPVGIASTANLGRGAARVVAAGAVAAADRARHRLRQPGRARASEARPAGRCRALRAGCRARGRRGGLLDVVPDPQRRVAARAPGPQPARLGHCA